jgi:flavorubredoxin
MCKLSDGVFWTGYIDWNIRVFHGYTTPSGSTYNAYLLLDDKPTLIDTVKYYGSDEMQRRIKDLIDPGKIRYIISNHTEMDHSGTIDDLLKYCPQAEVVCSPKGAEGLQRHFKKNWKMKVVNTGDVLEIGRRKLKFVLMPMVHWPDSMATYSEQDKILFPNDAFGQHYASAARYADQAGLDVVWQAAAKYYANIILPYGAQVLKVLEVIKDLAIDVIAPSHGLIWRRPEDIGKITGLYRKWASHETEKRVVIVYDTMWRSTEMMARRLYELLYKEGIPVTLMKVPETHISDVMTEILYSRMVLFGTPMLNSRMLPTMAALLMYVKGLKTRNRLAWTFGSYGWATVGFKELENSVKEAGFQLVADGKYVQYVPGEAELEKLAEHVAVLRDKLLTGQLPEEDGR